MFPNLTYMRNHLFNLQHIAAVLRKIHIGLHAPLINTQLQRGGTARDESANRFSGFYAVPETAEAVPSSVRQPPTPLKQGGNENRPYRATRAFELLQPALLLILVCALTVRAQAPSNSPTQKSGPAPDFDFPPPDGPPGFDGPPPGGPGDFGPGGPGPGGPGGMKRETKLIKQFDKNGDGWLNQEERKAARAFLSQPGESRGRGGPGRPGGFGRPGGNETTPQPGRKLTPADVQSFPDAPMYASNVLRTFFLEFENAEIGRAHV